MSDIKGRERFAELERLMGDYFVCHISPIMKSTKAYLGNRQAEEMLEYSRSAASILHSMATAGMPGGDPYQTLKLTGEWNSKTTDDYLLMCKEKIGNSENIQKDLALIAGEWRTAVIDEIGRPRYDELSEQLGCDLSYAFMDYRMEQLMIDKLVKDNMPKSSAEYIIRKAGESSIFGLSQTLNRTSLEAEIATRGETAYKPPATEKGAGIAIGAVADAVTLGGVGTWGRFAKFVGVDIAFSAASTSLENKRTDTPTVEDSISKGVFGSDTNVFNMFREDSKRINTGENDYIKGINASLNNKTPILNLNFMKWNKTKTEQILFWQPDSATTSEAKEDRYKDVPMVVAPGQKEQYLQEMARLEAGEKRNERAGLHSSTIQSESGKVSKQEEMQQQIPTNENGWNGFLSNFGLDGFGDITKNLGYVLATLPDILVGLFTGKTKSFNMDNSLMPIASILAGMFVRNPVLKMLLIGMGGANLINRAGHEALERKQYENGKPVSRESSPKYKSYAEEALNPRIGNPVLQGNSLIATIDKVPCTIQLPQVVIDAHHAGALPLTTLANAVLAKSDAMRHMAAQNYDHSEQETVVHTRGIQ